MNKTDFKKYIRNIPDFPKKGILFRDITTLLSNKHALKMTINLLSSEFKDKNIDLVVAAEARGFIFGGAIAAKLNAGFIPVRKKGKLPYKSYSANYNLEYGVDRLEIHQDAFKKGARVLILDDLLATGGTVEAIINLVKQLEGKIIGVCFLIELTDLGGRKNLKEYPVYSLIKY